jgi:hypothetical protein
MLISSACLLVDAYGPGALAVSSVDWQSKCEVNTFSKSPLVLALNGGRYWDRTSGPCRVKAALKW